MILADAEFPSHELLEVARLARSHVHAIGSVLIWIAIPLALIPPVPTSWRWIWMRTVVITVAVWLALMDFRIAYEVPWNRTVMDIEKRDWGYDGVGGNVALLFFGWGFPFFEAFITLCLTRFILSLAVNRKTAPQTIVGPPSPTDAGVTSKHGNSAS
ncbi:MAG: hypothetical protein J0L73_03720 [Verrucomicrobia bacterium]|nr:hypothetical protein [Verrucomicrobiota bacterium]